MKAVYTLLVVLALFVARPIAQSAPPEGEWDITTSSPVGEQTNRIVISKTGDGYKAVAKSDLGERPYDSISVAGKEITIVLTVQYEGSPMMITYTGTFDDKNMNGGADFGGLAQGSWSAVRPAPKK